MKKNILLVVCMLVSYSFYAQTATIDFSSTTINHLPDFVTGTAGINQRGVTSSDISTIPVGSGKWFAADTWGGSNPSPYDFDIQSAGGNPDAYLSRTSISQYAKGIAYVFNNTNGGVTGTLNLGFDFLHTTGGGRSADRLSYKVYGIQDDANDGVEDYIRLSGGSGPSGDNDATKYVGSDGTQLAGNNALGLANNWSTESYSIDVTGYEYIVIVVGVAFGSDIDTNSENIEDVFGLDNVIIPSATASATRWTGATDTDWATPGNWDNGVPTTSSDVTIPAGLSNYPTVTTAETINSLTIGNGARLVATNAGFTVTNNATYVRSLDTGNRWYLASSPVVGEMYDDDWNNANSIASGSGNNRGVSWYDNSVNDVTTGHWRYLQATNTGSFDVAKGYSVRPSSSVNSTFIGTGIYTADQTFALEQGVNNFNLVGNPFTAH